MSLPVCPSRVLHSPGRRRGLWCASALTLAALLGGIATGAAPALGAPSPSPTSSASGGATGTPSAPTDDTVLTSAQVSAQLAQAEQLRAELAATDAAIAAANTKLQDLGARAADALERWQVASRESAQQHQESLTQLTRLARLQAQVDQSLGELGQWARQAYATGGAFEEWNAWMTVLENPTTGDVSHDLSILDYVGRAKGVTLDRIQLRTAAQRDAAVRAAVAAERSKAAAKLAATARTQADQLVAQQRTALAELQAQRAVTAGKAELAHQELVRLRAADALAAEAAASAIGSGHGPSKQGPVGPGDCKGADVSGYPNGLIPLSALCPLWGAPGQLLRADAAAGFNRLAREFAAEFARPLCVTDSYRTFAEQVAVRAAKPQLAAVPGTSNHGWGIALDLCGGIESFGTPEHEWMLGHAPLYGWFHPSWAEPGGSKPEPWHWEFGGMLSS